jgi:hypothetical protein
MATIAARAASQFGCMLPMNRVVRNEGDCMTAITKKLITPRPVMQLARVLADADGMMEITDNDLVECGYVAMARAALDHLQSLNNTTCDEPMIPPLTRP